MSVKSKRITMWAVGYTNKPDLPWKIFATSEMARIMSDGNAVFKVYFDYVKPEPIKLRAKP